MIPAHWYERLYFFVEEVLEDTIEDARQEGYELGVEDTNDLIAELAYEDTFCPNCKDLI